MKENNLIVTSVRYFETHRGLGYEAKTSVPGVSIWNDGMGGGTYVSSTLAYFNHGDFHETFFPDITYGSIDYENALEEVISIHEGV
jgi:hypothetical protein